MDIIKPRMPENWTPPYPAYSSLINTGNTDLVIAYYGAQTKEENGSKAKDFKLWFEKIKNHKNGPSVVERAKVVDNEGFLNIFFVAYWSDATGYNQWVESKEFLKYWESTERLSDSIGVWREVLRIPSKRFETVFSSADAVGAARACPHFRGPLQRHAYWGSMRDRIPSSSEDRFIGESEKLSKPVIRQTLGNRVIVESPENLTLIRSGQNLNDCKPDELAYYNEHISPALYEGMRYIAENPVETGCCINRFAEQLDDQWQAQQKTFGAAYFLSLEHLEQWAEHHPTHLKIFGNFFQMAQHFSLELDIKLWHEVVVLPKNGQLFEYVNCHPMTGLLPWFGVRPQMPTG